VVTTAAVARASANGDGFFSQPTPPAAAQAQPATAYAAPANAPARKVENGGTPMAQQGRAAGQTPTCAFGAAMQQGMNHRAPGWRWWAVAPIRARAFVNAADPAFNQLLGINDRGVVVGYRGSGADAQHPNRGYVVRPPYRQHDITDLKVPGAVQSQDVAINQAGAQAGFSIGADGATSGFVLAGDTLRTVHNPLGTAHPAVDQLLGINDQGVAAGFYNDAKGHSHGYLYNACNRSFRPVTLPVKADSVQATGVNDHGVVSGFYTSGKTTRGFVLDHGKINSLGFGNDTNTQVLGLDNAGDLVGSYVDGSKRTRGFVWSHNHLRTITVPHSTGTVVNGLNNRGQLVGFFTTSDHRTVGFLSS
jgi:hypothetical protein